MAPLQDQQLGGVIMWVPGCGLFLLVALLDMWRALSNPSALSRLQAR
jgi:putative membrane protein